MNANPEVPATLTLNKFGKISEKAIQRFHSKVNLNGPLPDQSNPPYEGMGPCNDWTGLLYPTGYGEAWIDGIKTGAHRAAWIIANGPIPKGMVIMHRCDRKCCVNPAHLRIGTPKENSKDMVIKGRAAKGDRNGSRIHPERRARGHRNGSKTKPETVIRGDDHYSRKKPESLARGESNGNSKLSAADIVNIRSWFNSGNVSKTEIGLKYGVHRALILKIVLRRIWRHVA